MIRDVTYFVYILASRSRTLYIGMTNSLLRRIAEHKDGSASEFTKKYNIHRLVYYEAFQHVNDAIRRETQLKGWRRSKKIALIESSNPAWADLAEEFTRPIKFREPRSL